MICGTVYRKVYFESCSIPVQEKGRKLPMSSRNKGILCILSSAFFFALMSVFVRLSGDVPSMQKVFFRNLVAIVIAVVMLAKDHQPVSFSGPAKVSLFFRALLGE